MEIVLVRHAKDEDGFRGGWSKRGLITEGFEQSRLLGEYLRNNKDLYNIKTIISSDLNRALQTANEVAKNLYLPITKSIEWRETNNGELAGMPNSEAERKYPGLYFSSLRMEERYPGGESPLENFNRIKNTFNNLCEDIVNQKIDSNVLVLTHGGVINIIYHILNNKEWTNKNKSYPVTNTSLHRIIYKEGKWEIADSNLTAHLNI
jgi:broad specificity phosphatase PhoE